MFEKVLSKRGLSFDRLRALAELAEAGSLAKAVGGDPTRQSQYSRQIKELEDYFGVQLTERRGHKLEVTGAGRRLVQIARETFSSLGDFQAECEGRPLSVTIASGASVLQWLLLPLLGKVQRIHRNLSIHLDDLKTNDVVAGLMETRVDIGIIRQSAVKKPLKSTRICRLTYSLFVPKGRVPSGKNMDWRMMLDGVPLALQTSGGQFHQTLLDAAKKEGVELKPALCCLSFTQAAHAVMTGEYASVLPTVAATELPEERFEKIPLPLLKDYERVVALAWNPRVTRVRPELEKVIKTLGRALQDVGSRC